MVRNAMDPHGRLVITDIQWKEQWEALREHLDAFTADVMADRPPTLIGKVFDHNE